MKYRLCILIVLGVSPLVLLSQSKQKLNVEGDFYYDTENYIEAEGYYQESADKKKDFKSLYNLGNSQEKQEKGEEAMDNYKNALPYAETDIHRAMAHYNMGNVLLNQKENMDIEKLETIIQHYKDAIRLYPSHSPAKHNLAAAQIALDMAKKQQEQEQQQQQEQQENQEEQDQDQEQQDQEQQENQEQQDQENQEQKPNQDQEQKSEEERKKEKKNIDKKEIENILKMVEKEDGEVQKKMRKQTKSETKDTKKKW